MFVFDKKSAFLFLTISLTIVIVSFFAASNKRMENFNEKYNNKTAMSSCNPKTLIAPIIAPPSHDMKAWSINNLAKHSATNNKTNFDLERAGFTVSTTSPFSRNFQEEWSTQTLQPGVYQRFDMLEPINSMTGISYTPQFSKPTQNFNRFSRLDDLPNYEESKFCDYLNNSQQQSVDNVYDPRFSGYGDNSRYYLDELTGRPCYNYKDVESITRPNFITRSHIDTVPLANTYGSDVPNPYISSPYFRNYINQNFHDSQINFRTEMQERLMRKRNAEMWQLRAAPIFRHSTTVGNGAGRSCL
jgi:hypothetical protein